MTNAKPLPASPTADEPAFVKLRLSRYDRLTIDGILCAPASATDTGHVTRRLDNADLCETFTHAELHHLLGQGRLKIERGYFHKAKAELRSLTGKATLLDLTPDRVGSFNFYSCLAPDNDALRGRLIVSE